VLTVVSDSAVIGRIGTEAAQFGRTVWPRTLAHTNISRIRQDDKNCPTSESANKTFKD